MEAVATPSRVGLAADSAYTIAALRDGSNVLLASKLLNVGDLWLGHATKVQSDARARNKRTHVNEATTPHTGWPRSLE